jgi:hypothetical protein
LTHGKPPFTNQGSDGGFATRSLPSRRPIFRR